MSQVGVGRKISVAEMAPHVHSFLPHENKVNKIADWLISWIVFSLKNGTISPYDFLPAKGDLAFHIGVSMGTIQNAFRIVEDRGFIESKQKIGTYIKDKCSSNIEKLTSKREAACKIIKNYLISNNYRVNDILISTRKIAEITNVPVSTIRVAINTLIIEGILIKKNNTFVVKSMDFKTANDIEPRTLVEKTAEHINEYIKNKLKPGDKLPSNNTLADMFNVSVKTIHDAVKILSVAGIIVTRRGYYGTVVKSFKDEDNISYYYEQIEKSIKKYIVENCKAGEKLPSIKQFAEIFNVSAKTIKNALNILADDGYINFLRGKYGGTFVLKLPDIYDKGYAWIALSKDYEQKNM